MGRIALRRLVSSTACVLWLTTACGGRVGYDDFHGSTGSSAATSGGAVSSSASTVSAGGASVNGGVGNEGNRPSSTDSTAGADAGNVNCATVDVRTTLSRGPLCTLPPITDQYGVSDCQNTPVNVYTEQTVTYFSTSNALQCAEGSMASVTLGQVGAAQGRGYHVETVTAQVLATGLVRLTCTSEGDEGYDGTYNVTCSTNGLQTIAPYFRSDVLYVEFPEDEVTTAGYEGSVGGYFRCAANGLECDGPPTD